jgi:hypothetical protein
MLRDEIGDLILGHARRMSCQDRSYSLDEADAESPE